ncbi:MAG: type II secretion system protein GspC [Gammaproteobacteria bacterium]|nr:MAG: type II secretion system protein GspC [Gammaproteobacteria bacterium]
MISLTLSRGLSAFVNIVLAAILGYCTIQLLLILLNKLPLYMQIKDQKFFSSPTLLNTRFSKQAIDISTLVGTQLFGKSKIKLQFATQIKKTHPDTKLNLKLQGIYYSSNPHISRAMIAAKSGKSAAYRIGQPLSNGVVLHKIYPKQVILLKNGQKETLHLIGTQKITTHKIKESVEVKRRQKEDKIKPEKLLGLYQRELKTNPSRLMKLVRLFPVNQGGRFVGYRLKPGKDTTLLSQFDLQSGDILTGINGVKMDSPLKGLGVVQQLATANRIDLEVLRHGRVVSLSFAVEK